MRPIYGCEADFFGQTVICKPTGKSKDFWMIDQGGVVGQSWLNGGQLISSKFLRLTLMLGKVTFARRVVIKCTFWRLFVKRMSVVGAAFPASIQLRRTSWIKYWIATLVDVGGSPVKWRLYPC